MNVKSIIQSHNKMVLSEKGEEESARCNCKKKGECPLNGECVIKNVIYEATVTTSNSVRLYLRLSTELSKHIWKLKEEGEDFDIKWRILRKIRQKGGSIRKVCSTCNLEKLEIALADRRKCLNKRNELIGKCVHYQKLYF